MQRFTCDCQICKTNADDLGLPFPLQADVPEKLAAALSTSHSVVYDAHNPSAIGEAMRRTTGVKPV